MGIKIIKPGLLTTIQDLGRIGYRRAGVTEGGALDKLALRLGNLLVGNPENAAALEITLMGPEILLEKDCLLALTGANLSAHLNGQPVSQWRPVWAKAGNILSFGKSITGCRAYLAVAGGFRVPAILGSYATYLRAGLGGFYGRAMQANDVIPINHYPELAKPVIQKLKLKVGAGNFAQTDWQLSTAYYPSLVPNPTIRALKGPEYFWFTPEAQALCWEASFQVTPRSDRMGLQLNGPGLDLLQPKELLSTAVTFGTVQVPAQGQPIVLLADHQTTGGYPRLAHVITADFTRLAQVKPGETVTFNEVNLPAAQQAGLAQKRSLENLKSILSFKFKQAV